MTTPIENPHSRWYHCFCCCPPPKEQEIQASPAGAWDNGKFEAGAPPPKDEFKKEFQGK